MTIPNHGGYTESDAKVKARMERRYWLNEKSLALRLAYEQHEASDITAAEAEDLCTWLDFTRFEQTIEADPFAEPPDERAALEQEIATYEFLRDNAYMQAPDPRPKIIDGTSSPEWWDAQNEVPF